MLNKLFKSLFISVLAILVFAGVSFANSYQTSVRLQQPESQTNKDTFDITFVALDTNPSQTVTVQCQKKGPSDAGFVNFGSLITLSSGGNTDVCHVNSGVVQGDGTFQFKVIANGSTTNLESNIVTVNRNTTTPGDPVAYNKNKTNNCTYIITFTTANDNGKTVKVVLYRSDNRDFTSGNVQQVGEVNIGSNSNGSMTDNINPNCDTTYYYVIRAYDAYGNGSNYVGDSSVTTTIVNPTTTQQQGAIAGGTNGNVLGAENGGTKGVLGTESAKVTPKATAKNGRGNPISSSINWLLTHKKIDLLVLIILGAIAYYLYRRNKK